MIIPSAETSETSSLSNNTAKKTPKIGSSAVKIPEILHPPNLSLYSTTKGKPTTYYTEINQTEETKPVKMDIPVFRQQ